MACVGIPPCPHRQIDPAIEGIRPPSSQTTRSGRVRPPRYCPLVGKVKRLFVCANCERPSAQWSGRCSACGSWGTVSEHPAGSSGAPHGGKLPAVLTLAPDPEEHRICTSFAGVDRVLGGVLVPSSVILLAGAPGIGKSTLLLQ